MKNPLLHAALEELCANGDRVVVATQAHHENAVVYHTQGYIVPSGPNTVAVSKTRTPTWYGKTVIAEAAVVAIRATTKCRSKRDIAAFGLYRTYYEQSPFAVADDGAIDMAATLRQYFG